MAHRLSVFTAAACALTTPFVASQSLVRDIEPATVGQSSAPRDLVGSGSAKAFFAARNGSGEELWVTDPSGNARMIRDIYPGPLGSQIAHITDLDGSGTVLFSAEDGVHGPELWRSDGSEAGTRLVRDLAPGVYGSFPRGLWRIGSDIYFGAEGGLWRSDGTATGTTLVQAFSHCSGEGFEFQGRWYFTTDFSEVWSTDGTPAGTQRLVDMMPIRRTSTAREFTTMGGELYWVALSGTREDALWRSDGTPAGTRKVVDFTSISRHSGIGGLVRRGTALLFSTDDSLWVSDGTPAGTSMLAAGVFGGTRPTGFGQLGGEVHFVAATNSGPSAIWSTDGTAAGTRAVHTFANGVDTPASGGSFFLPSANRWFFIADDGIAGREPWSSDGTTATRLSDIHPGVATSRPAFIGRWNGEIFLSAFDGSALGQEAWRTDGVAPPTLFGDFYTVSGLGSNPADFAPLDDGRVMFVVDLPSTGSELWVSDATAAGTRLVTDIVPGPIGGNPSWLSSMGDAVYFGARDAANTYSLRRSDGVTVTTIATVAVSSRIRELNGFLLFAGAPSSQRSDSELWTSDGTAAGTRRLVDVNPGVRGSAPSDLVVAGGLLYFVAEVAGAGRELWFSDGTAAGTRSLGDLRPGSRGSGASELTAIGGALYFRANDGVHGDEPWRTDGTTTRMVADVQPGPAGSNPSGFVEWAGRTYFGADDGVHGAELWSTDGTTSGTATAFDAGAGPSTGCIALGASDEFVYFDYFDGGVASGLWRTDGTAAGSGQILSVPPTTFYPRASTAVEDFTRIGDGPHAVFSAADLAHDRELWFTDGTAAGTRRMDINFETASDPGEFTLADRTIFFRAAAFATGSELWSMDVADLGASFATPYGAACDGTGGIAPRLAASAPPRAGDPTFALTVSGAVPRSAAAILFGPRRIDVPLGIRCSLLVGDVFAAVPRTTDATGSARLGVGLNASPGILGLDLATQAIVTDPAGGALGLASLSNGLRIIVGS